MSFVPAPQAPASANASNNGQVTKTTTTAGAAAPETEASDYDLLFKLRTFDVYWVEKKALMYKDGFDKVSERAACLKLCRLLFCCWFHPIVYSPQHSFTIYMCTFPPPPD